MAENFGFSGAAALGAVGVKSGAFMALQVFPLLQTLIPGLPSASNVNTDMLTRSYVKEARSVMFSVEADAGPMDCPTIIKVSPGTTTT